MRHICGISGYFSVKRVLETVGYDEIRKIVESIEHRGKDATGIYTNSVDKIYKAPLPPKTFFEYSENFNEFVDAIENSNAVIMHNRLSTSGSPSVNRNNQPFRLVNYIFAHNGVYWNEYSEYYEKKIKKTKIDRISDKHIENDSYELFKILFNINLQINEKTIADAIEHDYELVNYAFSVYDVNNNILYLSKDDDKPLYYLTDSKTLLIYCSEKHYLKKLRNKLSIELKLYTLNDYEIVKAEILYNRLYVTKYTISVDTSKYVYDYKKDYKKYSKKSKTYSYKYDYKYLYDEFEYFYYK